jgi:ankyrin repeat protein
MNKIIKNITLITCIMGFLCFNTYATKIYNACQERDFNKVKRLIDNGYDVNKKNYLGARPIHAACFKGDLNIVSLLIEKNARINEKDDSDNTALHIACEVGHFQIVKKLIESHIDVNIQNKEGQTALHVASDSRDMLFDIAHILVQKDIHINQKDNRGATALHRASYRGHEEIVKMLFENGAYINVYTKSKYTPLFSAYMSMSQNKKDIMRFLIDNGSCIDKNTIKHIILVGDTSLIKYISMHVHLDHKQMLILLSILKRKADKMHNQMKKEDLTKVIDACVEREERSFSLNDIDDNDPDYDHLIKRSIMNRNYKPFQSFIYKKPEHNDSIKKQAHLDTTRKIFKTTKMINNRSKFLNYSSPLLKSIHQKENNTYDVYKTEQIRHVRAYAVKNNLNNVYRSLMCAQAIEDTKLSDIDIKFKK